METVADGAVAGLDLYEGCKTSDRPDFARFVLEVLDALSEVLLCCGVDGGVDSGLGFAFDLTLEVLLIKGGVDGFLGFRFRRDLGAFPDI